MSSTRVTDQRREERIRTRLRVRLGVDRPERAEWTGTISVTGLYIDTNDVFPVGTRLVIEIEFPDRPVRLRGEVAWAIRVPAHQCGNMVCGMGIEFVSPDRSWPSFFEAWKTSHGAG